ncbi:short transient receptor potential channel 4-like [Nasonia vitripennis]|uniref:Ion transport domain-containing protein n=1 Tax=Nasonia vitripennis TaxID=7425 RepID=A0A7M7M1N9_NASVI|nr:short transient receptor potential channel 4-like [Nasonia vitripennis]
MNSVTEPELVGSLKSRDKGRPTRPIEIPVEMWPPQAIELLFFAIFGQTTHDGFRIVPRDKQAPWTIGMFKLAFAIYMLVSVVVLINLLIAMMSDTYQRIQAQSDIEWKYGLSKLIRNMHRTTTAPSPLNLITSWLTYLFRLCKKRKQKKDRPSLVNMMGLRQGGRLSARSKAGTKWLSKVKKTSQVAHKDSVTLSVMHLSPLGSQLSFGNATRIESVVDWDVVRRKYRELQGEVSDKSGMDSKDDSESDSQLMPVDDASPSLVGSQATLIASTS